MKPIILFTAATLIPVPLLGSAAVFGGLWAAAALFYMTGLVFALDTLVRYVVPPQTDMEFPAADTLSVALGVLHFPLLTLIIVQLATGTLGLAEMAALFVAAGLYFGQVGNSNAHELIHKGTRGLHNLGKWVYISLLFGHHTSAHVLVHHRSVATDNDPNTARLGEGFYRYALRAWKGSFIAGYRAEQARLERVSRSTLHNPYLVYFAGSALFCGLALALIGPTGLLWYLALAAYTQVQLLLSDYVQHYGLTRNQNPDGRFEPVGDLHSWDAPHWFSSALMLNAPRHADHHAHPSKPFPALEGTKAGPVLPRSLPTMATIALVPTLWRRMMDHRALQWQS